MRVLLSYDNDEEFFILRDMEAEILKLPDIIGMIQFRQGNNPLSIDIGKHLPLVEVKHELVGLLSVIEQNHDLIELVLPHLDFIKHLPCVDCPLLLKCLYPLTHSQLCLGETLEIPVYDRLLVSKFSVFEIRLLFLVILMVVMTEPVLSRLLFFRIIFLPCEPGLIIDRVGIMVQGDHLI